MWISKENKNIGKIFAYYLLGFLILTVSHEFIHGYIAKQYCEQVSYQWIPTKNYLMATSYKNCTNMQSLNFLQSIVEIVGYHLMAFYTAIASFIILYKEKADSDRVF